ncbi:unnamed protein product [Withania somnifera]
MLIAKNSIVLLLMIFVTFSSIQKDVLGGRYLQGNKITEEAQSPVATKTSSSSHVGDEGGFVAYVNREVPSSPDPVHNR